MNLKFPQLLAGSIGALLIYCAIVNKTPVQVIQDAFKSSGGTDKSTFGTASGQASATGSSGHNYNLP